MSYRQRIQDICYSPGMLLACFAIFLPGFIFVSKGCNDYSIFVWIGPGWFICTSFMLLWGVWSNNINYISYVELDEETITVRYSIYDREYELKNIPLDQIKLKIKPDNWSRYSRFFLRMRYHDLVITFHEAGDWSQDKIQEVGKIINKAAGEKHPYEFEPPYRHLPRHSKW